MLIVTRNEQRLLTSELAVFGLIGCHRRPGWPSSVAGVAVIGGRLAIIGRGDHLWPVGRLWPGWPSLAWFSRNHQQHADGLLVKGRGVD